MKEEQIIINYTTHTLPHSLKELEDLKGILTDIDQPVTSQLSTILQLLCATTNNPKLVEYWLEQGANPYYLDIDGKTAFDYANKNPFYQKVWLHILLNRYARKFKPMDINKRHEFVCRLIQFEIIKHQLDEHERELQLYQDVKAIEIKE